MKYYTRRFVRPNDLNISNRLFGGQLLSWIDEEAAIYASCQMKHDRVVTKYMSDINFVSAAQQGDIVEIGIEVAKWGRTSITLSCEVRNKMTRQTIISIDNITMVALGEDGKPVAHGKTEIEYVKDRLKDADD